MTIWASLGEQELPAFGDITWGVTSGVSPYMTTIELEKTMADAVIAAIVPYVDDPSGTVERGAPAEGLQLHLSPPGELDAVTTSVFVVKVGPGSMPHTRKLTIADRRWKWSYPHVFKTYNLRKRTADVRANLSAGNPIEKAILVGDVKYFTYSLKPDGSLWTLSEMLLDVLSVVDPLATGGDLKVDPSVEAMVFENVEIDDNGASAIRRILGMMPGFDVYLTLDGRVQFYNEFSDEARANTAAVVERVEEKGFARDRSVISVGERSFVRPKHIDVLFNREIEVRFNFDEETGDEERKDFASYAILRNVMRLPDLMKEMTSLDGMKKTFVRSSWVDLQRYLSEVIAAEAKPSLVPGEWYPVTNALLRKFRASNFGYPTEVYTRGEGVPDAVWSARWNEFLASYRLIYALPPRALNRLYSFSALGAVALDSENGIRQPADVIMDFTAIPTMKGIQRTFDRSGRGSDAGGDRVSFDSWYVKGYNESWVSGTVAPFDVLVLDEQNGIIALVPRLNAYGMYDRILPGAPTQLTYASPITYWAGVIMNWLCMRAEFKMSVILSVSCAAPNDVSRLHRHRVTAEDIGKILGPGVDIGDCNGPPMEIRVGPAGGWWSARYFWRDDLANQLYTAAFGLQDSMPQADVDNALDITFANRDEIKALAEASAAAAMVEMLDWPEGRATVPWYPGASPGGRVKGVYHRVAKNGSYDTMVSVPGAPIVREYWSFLPAALRQQLLRQVQL